MVTGFEVIFSKGVFHMTEYQKIEKKVGTIFGQAGKLGLYGCGWRTSLDAGPW